MTISSAAASSLNGAEQVDGLLREAWTKSEGPQPSLARVSFIQAIELDATGRALSEFGYWLWLSGKWDESLAAFQSLLRLADLNADTQLRAIACNNMASIYRETGRSGAAAVYQQQSLKSELSQLENHLARETESGATSVPSANLGCDWGNRANDAILAGDYLLAERLLEVSLRWEQAQGSIAGQAADFGNLGILASLQGDLRRALSCFRQAWRLHRRCGDRRGWACDLEHLGLIYSQLGKHKAAIRLLEWAVIELQEAGFDEQAAQCHVYLDEAERHLQIATFDVLRN